MNFDVFRKFVKKKKKWSTSTEIVFIENMTTWNSDKETREEMFLLDSKAIHVIELNTG